MTPKAIRHYFLLTLLIGGLVLMAMILMPFLTAILLAITLALIFYPVYEKVLKLLKGRQNIASLITVAIIIILILLPLLFLGFQIFQESRGLYNQIAQDELGFGVLEQWIEATEQQIQMFMPGFTIDIHQAIEQAAAWLTQNLAGIFAAVTNAILILVVSMLACYYLLKEGKILKKKIVELSPLSDKYDERIFRQLKLTIFSVVRGSLMLALIEGALVGIGFLLFGVPNAVLWGAIAAIISLIPALGVTIVAFGGAIYLFFTGEVIAAIGLTLWAMFVVGLVDNFLIPKLFRQGISLHPFLILISVLGGIHLFGIIGFVLGPIILSFFLTMLDVYKKELPNSA